MGEWTEKNGVITLPSITSDGTAGYQWIARLKERGVYMFDRESEIFHRTCKVWGFQPTKDVTYNPFIFKGKLWSDGERNYKTISHDAWSGKFTEGECLIDPRQEVVCWIRFLYTDEDFQKMGLSLIRPIFAHVMIGNANPSLATLAIERNDSGVYELSQRYIDLYSNYPSDYGFLFCPRTQVLNEIA